MVRRDQTSDAQLRIGESLDSGFDASHRPGMTISLSCAGKSANRVFSLDDPGIHHTSRDCLLFDELRRQARQ
jgi:hypothetical protein